MNNPIRAGAYFFLMMSAFAAVRVGEKILIPRLSSSAKQPIYEGGPSWHAKKSGTPTLGGLAFFPAAALALVPAVLSACAANDARTAISLALVFGYALACGAIGILDDLAKIRKKQNAGLTVLQKLILQSAATALFLFGRGALLGDATALRFSFGEIELGILYYPLLFFFLVFFVNAVNLTDGIDGLAASVACGMGFAFLIFASLLSSPAAAALGAILAGISLAFLTFNFHPAAIFMGDAGSLFLGGLIAGAALTLGRPTVILTAGGFYVFEGISVLLQVLFYKITKKRLFRMAPFHHHLEKKGWPEERICFFALLLTAALAAFGIFLL